MTCPVSWLRLERYALGELDPVMRAEIQAHVASCSSCRDDLAQINGDVRPLPLLSPRRRWRWALAGAAVAAVLLVALRGAGPRLKGGDLALNLVLERNGTAQRATGTFQPQDFIQVQLTCSHGQTPFTVVVFEGDAPGVAVGQGAVTCGNQRPLPAAFRATSPLPLGVCVSLTQDAGPWPTPTSLPQPVICERLRPTSSP